MNRFLSIISFACVVLLPQLAFAFCGFYVSGGDASLFNDATQVALVRDGTRTVLSMQNSYQGPPEAFAMVVPVPQVLDEANVKTLDKGVFDRLDKLTAPRLVEYWERDPCGGQSKLWDWRRRDDMRFHEAQSSIAGSVDFGVTVESEFAVGEYDVVVLSAQDSTGLDAYLRAEQYNIPSGAEPYLRPYVEGGSYFFVAKVDPSRTKFEDGRAVLSPLRFSYQSEKFTLPVRLGMINSKGEQDLIVYVFGQNTRYEVANYANAFIPTNLELHEDAKESFGQFYQSLFAATVAEHPGAVITEYSWQSSKCDPCPSPPMRVEESEALGIPAASAMQYTVTRLHARYKPDQIGEDLVFQAAEAVIGGREVQAPGGDYLEERRFAPGQANQFQGRYIIRHPWSGPVWCTNPKFGIWGPPSSFEKALFAATSPNTDGSQPLLEAKELGQWLKQGVAELGIEGTLPEPFSRPWLKIVFGYLMLVVPLVLILWGFRKLRDRRPKTFLILGVLYFATVFWCFQFMTMLMLGFSIGYGVLLIEGLVRRVKKEPAEHPEVP